MLTDFKHPCLLNWSLWNAKIDFNADFLISDINIWYQKISFWYQKINFWYQKMCEFLISENDHDFLYQKFMYFLKSEIWFSEIRNYFLISEILIFWYQKIISDTRKSNFWYHFLISEILIFWYQKIMFHTRKSNFWYQKISIKVLVGILLILVST